MEAVQIVDIAIVLDGCWDIHYSTSNQVALSGFRVGEGSLIWSNGAAPVPLAEIVEDSVGQGGSSASHPQHSAIGGHCTQHLWAGQKHMPRSTCQEHFEAVFGKRPGVNEIFADNLNLFMPADIGGDLHPQFVTCTGQAGQEITIRALHSIQIGVSLCPLGSGSTAENGDEPFWERQDSIEVYHPVRFTVRSADRTGADRRGRLPSGPTR